MVERSRVRTPTRPAHCFGYGVDGPSDIALRWNVKQKDDVMATEGPVRHVEATVQQLADFNDEHERSAGAIQKLADRTTATLARPLALTIIFTAIIAWIIGNYAAHVVGSAALDQFPFPDLEFAATIAALLVALLILTTQRHEQLMADKRASLTLQIAILSEKKIAKLIALIEEQRRDNPLLPSRIDAEATEMATATDPKFSMARMDASEANGS